ncbi:diguanylate cyclase (GGDEF)-like protein/PAS domain S-box-containing protein [Desulfosalsimonas propionicica]|uniref:Diguanylate cyclase (GGDEF)-like protein/PAS domain S-box-containing protein n=1 Tax=Desulfosalsimonas propionicica TaxID=332175 RepID=A0A7W0HK68_9BACT|nr:bifunctional diguanylate cyclase/phosphodiesterase [Desulfosalsimonas propionicica]MBA2880776.1 diguanylate cyclase (GGDEF)-like protein/PAS domain S-box-containing protein [Desulfosalsimonas propionicica]
MIDRGAKNTDFSHDHPQEPIISSEVLMDAPIGIFTSLPEGRLLSANHTLAQMLGYEASCELIEVITNLAQNIYAHPEDRKQMKNLLETRGEIHDYRCQWVDRNGRIFWVSIHIKAMKAKKGKTAFYQGFVTDITGRKEAEEEMELLMAAVEKASDWIIITDTNGMIRYANKAAEKLSGYAKEELIGKTPRIFKSGKHDRQYYKEMWDTLLDGNTFQGILTNRRKDGKLFEIYHTITPVRTDAGQLSFFVVTSKDLTEQRILEKRINHLAHYDPLSGLPNRRLFLELLSQSMGLVEKDKNLVAVMILDLDRFNLINDTLGPSCGDAVLRETANRINSVSDEKSIVAKIGSDEFGIILSEISQTEEVLRYVRKYLKIVSQPMLIEDNELLVTVSIGISVYPNDSENAEELMQYANLAMSDVRSQGANNYQFYAEGMNIRVSEFVHMEKKLYDALSNNEFFLVYQPYVDTQTHHVRGMEALIRWQSPESGEILPGKFIPVLEESRLLAEVGEWIVKTVCRQIASWQGKGLNVVPVAVNFSSIQFKQKGFSAHLSDIIQKAGIDPRLLTCEITESTFMEDVTNTRETLEAIRDLGAAVSIDDFGTGYSSLSYLKRLPVNNLKIDISFIRNIAQDTDDATIVSTIISMAHHLGLKTIAEGVETGEQLKILRLLGCDMIQGFYFSKPVRAAVIEDRLSKPIA